MRIFLAALLLISTEPNVETASHWWRDLRHQWTPVGWKDHMFRFNVFYNGSILAQPDVNRRTAAWKDQGLLINIVPRSPSTVLNPVYLRRDDGSVTQGWNDGHAPVLWSEWTQDGLLLRSQVFAHAPEEVKTGVEPLFAWVRLSVHYACEALPLEKEVVFDLRLQAPHYTYDMNTEENIIPHFEKSKYPRPLTLESNLVMDDGKVRLGVKGEGKLRSSNTFSVKLPAKKGEFVDVLVPMIPTDREVFEREIALGYEAALKQANEFWSRIPPTAARIETPEKLINETIRHSLKFAEVLGEKNPADGHYAMISGSLQYPNLWTTPFSMACIMLLDTMGYHPVVEKYLEIFRATQGQVKPPSRQLDRHPGYFGTPPKLKSIDWLPDHGATLYTVCRHAVLSRDEEFLKKWLPSIEKALEFIQHARKIGDGVMPPATATDSGSQIQGVWTDGWMYKGLTEANRVLRRIGHPRAAEFEKEAKEYREAFVQALRNRCKTTPRWTDRKGQEHPFVPVALSRETRLDTRHPFYLDTGPLFLVYSGLLDEDDPLMRATLLWFREGPQVQLVRQDSNLFQVGALHYEMSSCEPCYSWNVFHSLAAGDRQKYLEGMYSLFAGSVSRQTYISCETRGGITGNIFSAPLAIYLARLAVIEERGDELHLLRLCPQAWLSGSTFENMPTEFGPVSLKFHREGSTLHVTVKSPKKPIFHKPPGIDRIEEH